MNGKETGLLVLLTLLLFGCNNEDVQKLDYQLEGNWEIYEAYRDDELTTTLEDGYFKFSDSTLETNILGSPISGQFDLKNNTFSHQSSLPVKYVISDYSSDSMELDTEIRGFSFKFKLGKVLDTLEIK